MRRALALVVLGAMVAAYLATSLVTSEQPPQAKLPAALRNDPESDGKGRLAAYTSLARHGGGSAVVLAPNGTSTFPDRCIAYRDGVAAREDACRIVMGPGSAPLWIPGRDGEAVRVDWVLHASWQSGGAQSVHAFDHEDRVMYSWHGARWWAHFLVTE